ncbi:MAG: response regulator transcription factor [Saprospiraceae bacterium]|nr:response regulator transcription factor [Bacteroidia bacterium]NNL93148.1 response regulator transcription factor [Saprospiraceae bacterium]
MIKILYLEDENYLGKIVKESLTSRGYDINHVIDGADVMRTFRSFNPDICVLDVMVPNIDGFELGSLIKKEDSSMPIIFLTAKNQTNDILQGFKSGGNDYIKKPFSMEELIVRIENILRLSKPNYNATKGLKIPIGQYYFKYDKFELTHKSEIISLSHRENELIYLFSQNLNKKIDRRYILNALWGDDSLYNSRNLDVYIRKIRVYFEKDPKIRITTLRGVGYFMSVEE